MRLHIAVRSTCMKKGEIIKKYVATLPVWLQWPQDNVWNGKVEAKSYDDNDHRWALYSVHKIQLYIPDYFIWLFLITENNTFSCPVKFALAVQFSILIFLFLYFFGFVLIWMHLFTLNLLILPFWDNEGYFFSILIEYFHQSSFWACLSLIKWPQMQSALLLLHLTTAAPLPGFWVMGDFLLLWSLQWNFDHCPVEANFPELYDILTFLCRQT